MSRQKSAKSIPKFLQKRLRKESWMTAASRLDGDPEFCSLVPLCNNADIRRQVVSIIRSALEIGKAPVWVQSEPSDVVFGCLLNYGGTISNCPNLSRAVASYRKPNRNGRPEPFAPLDRSETPTDPIQSISEGEDDAPEIQTNEPAFDEGCDLLRRLLTDNMPQWFLDRLDEPYPPLGVWVADNAQIVQAWEVQAKSLKRTIHLLQPERLLMTIHEHESAHICDSQDNLVAFVWRNFCSDQSFTDNVLQSTTEARNSLLLVGDATVIDFSSISSPGSGPASTMPTFWDLCRILLPVEIVSDIQSRRAYPNHPSNVQKLSSGCVSKNYSSAIAREAQSPTWKVLWIIKQTFNNDHGGSFYLSDYGLRVEAATNTLIAWNSSDAHGFSLFDLGRCRQGLLQSGLTIGSLTGLLASLRTS